jgi:FHS family L-fucose permease-like MFS transporter
LTQAFNSLGTAIAPFFGAALILSVAAVEVSQTQGLDLEAVKQAEASAVQIPYLMLAASLFVLAAIFALLKLPAIEHKPTVKTASNDSHPSIFTYRHLTLGALGIFLYVGAEVSIGSFMVNFLGKENIANLAESEAANYVAYYWAGAMVGRFIGAAVMQKISGGIVLAFNAAVAAGLLLVAILGQGWIAAWSILLIGLCNSIMFPVIFSLGVNQLGERTSEGSGILCLAIAGGAIVPLAQGFLADNIGLQLAFVLPLFCYLYIVFYGLKGSKPVTRLP